MDYAFGGVTAYSNITFAAGTAVAWFELPGSGGPGFGIALQDGVAVSFLGSLEAPCIFARYESVMEGGNGLWKDKGWLAGIEDGGSYDLTNPSVVSAIFSRFYHLATDPSHIRDGSTGQPISITARSCEFYGSFGGYDMVGIYTNCLFYRGGTGIDTGVTNVSQTVVNCSFYGGALNFQHREYSPPYWPSLVKNCTFDNTTFDIDDPFGTNAAYGDYNFNAFRSGAPVPPSEGTNTVTVTNFNWQNGWFGAFYLPSDSPLIDQGSSTGGHLGLYHFTTQTNQTPEADSIVDIGYHYVAMDANDLPVDSNGDGIPDYIEDANGDGLVDNGETNWALAIVTQPQNLLMNAGNNAVLTVTAEGVLPLHYQWYFDGTNTLGGATNSSLEVSNIQLSQAGIYSVVVSNQITTLVSSNAVVEVISNSLVFSNFCGAIPMVMNGFAPPGTSPWVAMETNTADGCVLEIVDPATSIAGSAFTESPLPLPANASFSTFFAFRMSRGGGIAINPSDGVTGADGFMFVIQTRTNNALGWGGGNLGYGASAPWQVFTNCSVGVEFDTWGNNGDNGIYDPILSGTNIDGNHIGIDTNGSMESLTYAHIADPLNNSNVWYVWIDYNGTSSNMEVRLSETNNRPAAATLSSTIALPDYLGSTNVYFGFTAGTGGDYNADDILFWQLNLTYQPIGQTNLSVTITSPINRTFLARTNITLTAVVSNTGPSAPVNLVEFFVGTNGIGFANSTNGTFQINWAAPTGGTNVFRALAIETNGSVVWSGPVTNYFHGLPSITITRPTNGQPFLMVVPMTATNIAVAAITLANQGTVTNVAFYEGTNYLGAGTLSSSNVIFNWTGLTNGVYSLHAEAIANDGGISMSSPVQFTVNHTNQPPHVDAGPNQTTNLPNAEIQLAGVVGDDGLPSNYLATTWSLVSGPGTVSFGGSNQPVTTATFSTNGIYVLSLTASDGQLTATGNVSITVLVSNGPPFVYAGPDQSLTNMVTGVFPPTAVILHGVVTDDGHPTNGSLISTWSVISGPGSVSFMDANATNSIAVFDQLGSYVLELTANDGQLTARSQMTITLSSLDIVPYQATNYLYIFGATTNQLFLNMTNPELANFFTTNYNDSIWTNGQGGFGNGAYLSPDDPMSTCPLDNSNFTKTYWPGQSVDSNTVRSLFVPYLYLRRHFTVPPGTTNLSMGFTVDNDVQVYINGTPITPQDIYSNGVTIIHSNVGQFLTMDSVFDANMDDPRYFFFTHVGCAAYDDIILNGISTNLWHTNDNLLAVCAVDQETTGNCFYDSQISVNTWLTGTNGPIPGITNHAPIVYAGRNQLLMMTNSPVVVQLTGMVVDDGLPGAGQAIATWTNVSGPGSVYFDTPSQGFTNFAYINTLAAFTNPGTFTLQLVANDGELSATGFVSVTIISNAIAPPVVALTAPIIGSFYQLGDVISLAANASASGGMITQVVFFANSGSINRTLIGMAKTAPYGMNWMPPSSGDYTLAAEATDSGGRVGDSAPVAIHVAGVTNHPPVATNCQYTVFANSANNVENPLAGVTDADNDPLALASLTWGGAAGLSIVTSIGGTATIINNGRAITYTPPAGTRGIDRFTYHVSDGRGGSANADIIVNIYASGLPSVALVASNSTVTAGMSDPLIATVSPSQYITKVDFYQGQALLGTVTNGTNGIFTFTWQAVANACGCGFTAQATDAFGQVNTSPEISIDVNTNGLQGMVIAALNAIGGTNGTTALNATNAVFIRNGLATVYGQAYHSMGSNVWWNLGVYTVDGATLLRNLGSGTATNVVAACDFTTLNNGVYDLKLTVVGGFQTASIDVPFTLECALKVGQFSFSQQDLVIPVNGIPLTVTRTYNSINSDKGDFGYGWTYTLGDMDVALDETRNNYFDVDGVDEDDLPGGYFSMRDGGGRDVTLTLPNGQRTTFLFYLSQVDDYHYKAAWRAAPGVTATLTAQGNDIFYTTPGYGSGWDGEVPFDNYDFQGFVLTTLDGTQYFLDRDSLGEHSNGGDWEVDTYGPPHLTRIVQRSGDTIAVSPNVITHTYPNGATSRIVIQRNANGLISSISDPAGLNSDNTPNGPAAVQYQYDATDNLISVLNLVDRNIGTYVTNSFSYTNLNFPHYITGIINADGTQVAKNFYDDSGKLTAVQDADGNWTQFIHDLQNNMEVIVDRRGYTNTYVYDPQGNVIVQTNQVGQVTAMAYDNNNNKTNEVTFSHGVPYATNSYFYGPANLLLASTDPLEHTNGFTYDQYGNVSTSSDALGNTTVNDYDPQTGLLTSTADALGHTTVNSYNNGLLISSTDPIGTVTRNSYDGFDNVIATATMDSDGGILSSNSFGYDSNGNRTNSTVWRRVGTTWVGATTAYVYDAMNRVIQTINPDGGTNIVIYNSIGKQQATEDPLGNITTYTYDDQGRLIGTVYPDSTVETSAYDASGNQVSSTDRGGRVTLYQYDPLNRLINTIYADNTTNETVYDDLGRVAQTVDARGTITAFAYDAASRRLAVTNAVDVGGVQTVSRYGYDANGNQITITDGNLHTTTNVVDALNRIIQVEYPDGTATSSSYDAAGRRVAGTDQNGVVTGFGYDGAGRLTSVTNGLSQVTRYQYDETGNEVAQIDALNRTNTYVYDGMGRRIAHILPGGQAEGFAFDWAGNQAYWTNFNGVVIHSQYDAMNRLTNKTTTTGYQVTFAYDAMGQRTNMTDASGASTYSYDRRDRLVLKTVGNPVWGTTALAYEYDADGNRIGFWSLYVQARPTGTYYYPYGGVTNGYQYDALNRLTNVLAAGAAAAGYEYDPAGNLRGAWYGNGVTNGCQYDSLNRLTNRVWGSPAGPLADDYYRLGANGNRTNVNESLGAFRQTNAWTYDALYRLVNEAIRTNPGAASLGYAYDAVGNRTSRTIAGGGLGLTNQSFTFNPNDWLNTEQYDAAGNVTNAGGNYYQYDALNHLVDVNNGQITYVYDGDGNRVGKTVNGNTIYYLVDDRGPSGYPQVVEEWREADYSLEVYNWGVDLISQEQLDFSYEMVTNVVYYGYDGQGSVRFLTDTNGTVTDTYAYDAYGTLTASSGTTSNSFLYCGQQLDADLGLYYNRARYYNPNTGRFWSADSYAGNNEDPLSLHKYLYAEDEPVDNDDPSGNAVYFVERAFTSAWKAPAWYLKSGHGYLLFTPSSDPGTDPFTTGQKIVATFSWHPATWDYNGGFSAQTPGRVWEDGPGDDQPGNHLALPVTTDPSAQAALMTCVRNWIASKNSGYDLGLAVGESENPSNQIGSGEHRDPPEDSVYYSLDGQNCVWWATIMLVQSKISVPQSVYNSIKQFNHGVGDASQIINGTQSAYIVGRIDPIGAELRSIVGSAEAVGVGFEGF